MLGQRLKLRLRQKQRPMQRVTVMSRRAEGGNERLRETVQMPRQKQRRNLRLRLRPRLRVTMISRMLPEGKREKLV